MQNDIQDLIDILPDAILGLDAQANILWWNAAGEKLLGLTPAMLNAPIDAALPIDTIKTFCLASRPANMEVKLPHSPNMRVTVSVLIDKHQQRILYLRDITHLHHLEQMRQDFVANVSHELRTPLTVIHGYLESLLDDDALSAMHLSILDKVYQQSERMHKLIEDLLLLAELEADIASTNDLPIVDVPKLIEDIYEDAKLLSSKREHHIHLNIDEGLHLYGHSKELRGAFANLVYNAVNYTPAQEHITISWAQTEQGACFSVRDTGQGIDAKHLPRLTERFYRVDKARSRDSGGTGLGLAIVKHVLIRHDAELLIDSVLAQGSCFSCVFPAKLSCRQ